MSTRRSVAGWLTVVFIVGQLAILWVKELREQGSPLVQQYAFWGYAPNLIAAMSLPGLLLALALKRGGPLEDRYAWPQLWREYRTLGVALLATAGALLAWEFLQPFWANRTFDWQDVWASLLGAGAWLPLIFLARYCTRIPHTFVREHENP